MITVAQLVARLSVETTAFQMGMANAQGRLEGMTGSINRMARGMTQVGRFLTVGLTVPIIALGYESVKSGLNFQNSMELIRTQAGASQGEVNRMSQAVLSLTENQKLYGYSANEAAGAIRDIEFEGWRGAQALDVLKVAAAGARLGNADLKTVTDALTGAMQSFGIAPKNAAGAMTVLNAIVGQGRMTIGDLSDAMHSKMMPAAAALNINLAQMGAALDIFTSKNVPAASAANNLTTAFIKMASPSKQAIGIAKTMGFSFEELRAKLQSGGLPAALGTLSSAYQDMVKKVGQVNAGAMLMEAFGGSRTGASVASLVESYGLYMNRLKNIMKTENVGDFWKLAAADMNQPVNKIKSAMASLEASFTAIGVILAPVVAAIAKKLAELMSKFNALSPGTKKLIIEILGIAAAVGPVILILGSLAGAFTSIFALVMANPFTMIVAALIALGAAFVVAYEKSKTFRDIVNKAWADIKEYVGAAAAWVTAWVRSHWDQIRADTLAVWSAIRDYIRSVFEIIKAIFTTELAIAKAIWDRWHAQILAVLRASWDYIKSTVQNALQVIKGIIDIVMGLIHGDWSRVWKGIQEVFSGVWNQIIADIRLYLAEAEAALSAAWSVITSAASAAWNGLVGLASSVWGSIKNAIVSAANTIKGGLDTVWTSIKGAVSSAWQAIASTITGWARTIYTNVLSFFKDLARGVLTAMKTLLDAAAATVGFFPYLGGAIDAARQKINSALDGLNSESKTKAANGAKAAVAELGKVPPMAGTYTTPFRGAGAALGTALGSAVAPAAKAALAAVGAAIIASLAAAKAQAMAYLGAHSPSVLWAEEVGKPIGQGTVQGAVQSMSEMGTQIRDSIAKATPPGRDAAMTAAEEIVRSYLKGISGQKGNILKTVGDSIAGTLMEVGIAGDIQQAARTLGMNQAIAIAKGVIQGTPTIEQQVKAALKTAMDAAIQTALDSVNKAKTAFQTAFQNMLNLAMQAFDAWAATIKTKSEKALAAMQFQDSIASLTQAIVNANQQMVDAQSAFNAALGDAGDAGQALLVLLQALSAAQDQYNKDLAAGADAATLEADRQRIAAASAAVGGAVGDDPKLQALKQSYDAMMQATQAFNDAQRALEEERLQESATRERKALDEKLAMRRANFQKQLEALEKSLEKQGATEKVAHAKIMALFKKFGLDYKDWGDKFGEAIAQGLRDSIPSIEAAAEAIAAAIAKYLKLKSPAEKGPLSDLDKWLNPFVRTIAVGFRSADMDRWLAANLQFPRTMAALNVPGATLANSQLGASAPGGTVVYKLELHNPTIIGTGLEQAAQELYQPLRQASNRHGIRQGYGSGPSYAP